MSSKNNAHTPNAIWKKVTNTADTINNSIYYLISFTQKQTGMKNEYITMSDSCNKYRNFPCIMRKILLIYCPEIWGAHYAWVQKIWKKISVEIVFNTKLCKALKDRI